MKVTLEELEQLVSAGHIPKISTPSGLEKITDTYRKNGPGFELSFSDGSSFKCARNHKILINDEWIEAHELIVGMRMEEKTLAGMEEIGPQDWIDFTVDADHQSYYYNGMVHHNSGKSFIQYLIAQHYYRSFRHRTLIIVPTTSLVHQMNSDFIDYGCPEDYIHTIYEGKELNDAPFVITTWQSAIKQPQEWFDQFRVIMGDEAHNFQAKSLTTIMEMCIHAPYRFGFTGTISSDSKTHQLVLQGLFGKITRYVSTKDLIDDGTVANFEIKCLILNHPKEIKDKFRAEMRKLNKDKRPNAKAKKYAAEREFIVNNHKRNLFIRNLVWSLEGQNNLILFELVDKHGKLLEPMLRKEGRELHFIHGGVKGEERERIRHLVENDNINTVKMTFGKKEIIVDESEEIPLSDGSTIIASKITEKHDISDRWIKTRL